MYDRAIQLVPDCVMSINHWACLLLPLSKKKDNLGADVTSPSTTNLDNSPSRFIVLGGITSPPRLHLFWDGGSTMQA